MTRARAQIEAVATYFAAHPEAVSSDNYEAIRQDVIRNTNDNFDIHNTVCQKDEKWRKSPDLSVPALVEILLRRHAFCLTDLCEAIGDVPGGTPRDDADAMVLLHYNPVTGLYGQIGHTIHSEIYHLEPNLSKAEKDMVIMGLRAHAPRRRLTKNPDLIPVNNGIYERSTKNLRAYSPEHVFLTKSAVDYNPLAPNPIIRNEKDGTDWDVESWMSSLSDDPEVVELLWQVIGAAIRPNTPWDKVALLYSTRGGNGKGTYCELIRNICGRTAGLSIDGFSSPFGLEELIAVSAVVADENDVGGYIEKMANFKAAVTGDIIQINRKYKAPIAYRFRGFIVQCVNELLRVQDRTGSMARRLLYIPFTKCFVGNNTDAPERKYIKHDYLRRKEVLEYVLRRVLEMDYDELSVPAACEDVLHEHGLNNNPALNFAEEVLPALKWELAPFTFLYDLYRAWFERNNPSGRPISCRSFQSEILEILRSQDLGWECPDKTRLVRAFPRMSAPEPLIAEYGLDRWMNRTYKGNDPMKIGTLSPAGVSVAYRGITRKPADPQPGGNGPQGPSDGPNDPGPDTPANTVTAAQATSQSASQADAASTFVPTQSEPVSETVQNKNDPDQNPNRQIAMDQTGTEYQPLPDSTNPLPSPEPLPSDRPNQTAADSVSPTSAPEAPPKAERFYPG